MIRLTGILLAFALCGAGLLLGVRKRMQYAHIPILLASGAVCVLYMFGLCGLLRAGLYVLIAAGIAAWVPVLTRYRRELPNVLRRARPVLLFLLLGAAWALFISRGTLLTDGDDATHWYTVTKAIFADNALPHSPEILFRTYVPGTALWSYAVTQLTGFSFAKCLFAKHLLHLMCMASFLSMLPERRSIRMELCTVGLLLLASVTLSGSLYDLTVDTTVALVPLCGAVLLCAQRDERDPLPELLPMLCFTCLIKTSGLLLSACVIMMYGLLLKKNEMPRKARFVRELVLTLVPLLLFAAYRVRAGIVYPDGLGEQAVSLSRYIGLFREKGLRECVKIGIHLLKQLFDLHNAYSAVLLFWMSVLCVIGVRCRRNCELPKDRESDRAVSFPFAVFAVLFNAMLYLTYIFSMNSAESDVLNCIGRYYGTASAFFGGIALCFVLLRLRPWHSKRAAACILAILCAVNALCVDTAGFFGFRFSGIPECTFAKAAASCEEPMAYEGRNYLVLYCESDYQYFIRVYLRSYLRSPNVEIMTVEEMEQDPAALAATDADHLVMLGYAGVNGAKVREVLTLESTEQWGIYRIVRDAAEGGIQP